MVAIDGSLGVLGADAALGLVERIALSVVVVALVFGVKLGVTRWRRREDRELSSMANLLASSAIATTTAIGVLTLIVVWGLGGNLQRAFENLELSAYITNIILAVVIIGAAYAISDFLSHFIKEFAQDRAAVGRHEREILYRVSQMTVYVLAVLTIIGLFTDNLGSLLVGAGFLGIVVGIAAQQTLGAVLAGFILMFSRPFEVGDWIQVGDNEGTVTEITVVNTRIRSFDGEYITIPNDEVGANPIVNRTQRGRLRVEIDVGIDYDADPDRAAAVALDAVEDLDRVLSVPSPQVVAKEFCESSILLGVRVWIDNPSARRRWRVRTNGIGAIKAAFEAEGIKIPFPQRELMGRSEAGGLRLAGDDAEAASSDAFESDSEEQTHD
ncbi:mechanosensitive ion channel family protein [Haloferacaceae archaeon DSL9]